MKKNQDNFFRDISDILTQARNRAGKAVNLVMVYSYFEVGKRIAEETGCLQKGCRGDSG